MLDTNNKENVIVNCIHVGGRIVDWIELGTSKRWLKFTLVLSKNETRLDLALVDTLIPCNEIRYINSNRRETTTWRAATSAAQTSLINPFPLSEPKFPFSIN